MCFRATLASTQSIDICIVFSSQAKHEAGHPGSIDASSLLETFHRSWRIAKHLPFLLRRRSRRIQQSFEGRQRHLLAQYEL